MVVAAQEDGKRIGRIRLRRVADAAGESLEPAVWEMVEPGSTVRTDGWRGYNGLTELGYQHRVVQKRFCKEICVNGFFFLVFVFCSRSFLERSAAS